MFKKLMLGLLCGSLVVGGVALFSSYDLQQREAQAVTIPYVEYGTWNPTAGGTSTYTTQVGTYTKVGNIVTVFARMTINAIGTGSTANILGLPCPVDLTPLVYSTGPIYFSGLSQSVSSIVGVAGVQGASIITLYSTLTDGTGMSPNAVLTSGTTLLFSTTYQTDGTCS